MEYGVFFSGDSANYTNESHVNLILTGRVHCADRRASGPTCLFWRPATLLAQVPAAPDGPDSHLDSDVRSFTQDARMLRQASFCRWCGS